MVNATEVAEMTKSNPILLSLHNSSHLGWRLWLWWRRLSSDHYRLGHLDLLDNNWLLNHLHRWHICGGLHWHDLEWRHLNSLEVVELELLSPVDPALAGAVLEPALEALNLMLILINVIEVVLPLLVPSLIGLAAEINRLFTGKHI